MPAIPEKDPLVELLAWEIQAPLPGEFLDYLEVPPLVGGGEGETQPEADGEQLPLLHGVAGVDVVGAVEQPKSYWLVLNEAPPMGT